MSLEDSNIFDEPLGPHKFLGRRFCSVDTLPAVLYKYYVLLECVQFGTNVLSKRRQ